MVALDFEHLGPFMVLIPLIGTITCLSIAYHVRSYSNALAGAVIAWFVLVVLISVFDIFHNKDNKTFDWSPKLVDDFVPGLLLLVVVQSTPVTLILGAYLKLEQFREYLVQGIPGWHYVALSSYRIVGAGYFYLALNDVFTNYAVYHVGICDIIVGATAIPVALYWKNNGSSRSKPLVIGWNILGLVIDLVVVFTIFFLNLFGWFQKGKPMTLFLFFPVSTIVLFNVPLAMVIHCVILKNYDSMVISSGNLVSPAESAVDEVQAIGAAGPTNAQPSA